MRNPLPQTAREAKSAAGGGAGRAVRFGLLRTAQRLLNDPGLAVGEQPRTVWCHRAIATEYADEATITVYRAADGSDASVHGLVTCGSVWNCPVCASKVAEERRRELQLAMVKAAAEQLHPYLLTLTASHAVTDALSDLLEKQRLALKYFKSAKRYRKVAEETGRAGGVKAAECTYSDRNGWHPHSHEIIFAAPDADSGRTKRQLKRAWLEACIRAGLVPGVRSERAKGRGRRRLTIVGEPGDRLAAIRAHWRHGLDLTGGAYAAEYITKYGHDEAWGMSSEVTRGVAKAGARGRGWDETVHVTPFQLLAWASRGDRKAGALFREYAEAMAGKRQLVWSARLKDRLGITDATDEELACGADPMPDRQEVGQLVPEEWAVVLSRDAVPELIRYAAECCIDPRTGQSDLLDFIASLRARPRVARGTMARRSRVHDPHRTDLYVGSV